MKPETQPLTPAEAGLSLAVLSGPRGSVQAQQDNETGKPLPGWPCIEYTCQLSDSRRRVIWTGEYRLGVGHVKSRPRPNSMPQARQAIADALGRGGKWICPLQEVADVAATLARFQKVAPALNDVCASLLSDGSAFFDGQRFEDWAGDLGYSADSIKAKEIFEACDRIGRDLSRALSRDELARLREWAGNY